MKLCKAIIFLPLFVGIVAGYCNVYSEEERVTRKIKQCEPEGPLYAFYMLDDMIANSLTFEQFADRVHTFCEKILVNTLTCITQNVTVREDCQEEAEIQSMLNLEISKWFVTDFLCKNNATGYLDMAVDDGPTCYANNELRRVCVNQRKYRHIICGPTPLSNSNVCRFLNVMKNCSSIYTRCDNKNVGMHLGHAQQALLSRFGCVKQ